MKKAWVWLLVFVLAFSALAGCGSGKSDKVETAKQEGQTETAQQPAAQQNVNPAKGQMITILTGGTSGVYFPLGTTLAKIYTEKLGANSTAQTTGASAENSAKVSQKTAELAFVLADTVSDAYSGKGKFAQTGALDNLRAVTALYSNYMQLVTTKKSGITTLEDLKGKRVVVGAAGSGTEISALSILKTVGITYDDIKEEFLSFAEGIDGLKNGTVDAAFISSGIPNAGVMELAMTNEVVLVTIPTSVVEKLAVEYPAFTTEVVPAGTYNGVDQDIETAVVKNILITHADMSDDMVYELTKTLYDNVQTLKDTHSAAKDIVLEKGPKGMPLPLHPGAEKYFKEQGVLK